MTGGNWKEMFNAGCEGDLALVEHHVKSGVDVNYAHPRRWSRPFWRGRKRWPSIYWTMAPTRPSEFDAATPLQAARQVGLVAL
jgi:hypothetical protein